jgi:hypothetical protein
MSAIPLIISKSARRVMPVLAAAALLLGPTSAGAKPARNSVSAVDAGDHGCDPRESHAYVHGLQAQAAEPRRRRHRERRAREVPAR